MYVYIFRQFGFFSYLKDLFECPDAVMRYLCQLYRVHAIPVGTQKTKDNVENVIKRAPEISNFYTENHQVNLTVIVVC